MTLETAATGDRESAGDDGAAPTAVRLNKYLADHGVASRRKCDELIEKGKVSVDDQIVTELGLKIDPALQRVEIDGVVLKPERTRLRYYLLHKPRGVVCTNERREARLRAIDMITDPDKGRIYTVGRLDEDSQGLILLTNDGDFANRVAHPRYGVNKTYSVKLRGRVEADAIDKVRKGIRLSEGRTAPAFVKVLKRTNEWSLITVTLNEGKNREVRRVFAAVGYNVLQLRRTHIGTLSDRSLKEGKWRPLLREEVRELLEQSSEAAAPLADKREDPRTRHFKEQGVEDARREARGAPPRSSGRPAGPGRERRSPKDRGKWMRDRKQQLERLAAAAPPTGRRQRGEKRGRLLAQKRQRDTGSASHKQPSFRPGPRSDGPRSDGPRNAGPRSDGPRNAGPRNAGPRSDGARGSGPRRAAPGRDGPRAGGPHSKGPRSGGSSSGGSSSGAQRGPRKPTGDRGGRGRSGGPRRPQR
jgi:23S rRNA pseudouridine2605 synthase